MRILSPLGGFFPPRYHNKPFQTNYSQETITNHFNSIARNFLILPYSQVCAMPTCIFFWSYRNVMKFLGTASVSHTPLTDR